MVERSRDDALIVAGGTSAEELAGDPYIAVNLGEAFRHHKPIAAWGEGITVLEACGIAKDAAGVVVATKPSRTFSTELIEAIGWHRHWVRLMGV
jgi:catalase